MDDRMDLESPCVGADLSGVACVIEKTPGITRRGDPYLRVGLRNRTGHIRGKVWSEQLGLWDGIDVGDAVRASGTVSTGWNGGPPGDHDRVRRGALW